ncbi:hypothetical protein JXM67_11380 [candidate division WOR-3 bacterium]|nr:hypothetical protein [candidate division WOR-3 bacterium]
MKNLVVFKVAALVLFAALPLSAAKTEETSNQSFDAAYQRIEVDNINGWIKTSVSESNEISVTFNKWAQHPSGKKVDLDEIEIKVEENASDRTLDITIKLPKEHRESICYGCDIEITMPKNLYADLNTVNGAISAKGHQAGLNLETLNGGIEIEETSGEVEFTTINGAVKITDHSGNIMGATTNGVITASLQTPEKAGVCKLETVNGMLRVSVPETVDAKLTVSTVHGAIILDGKKVKANVLGKHEVSETLGDGSGTIELSAVNGSITLDRL